MNAIQKLVNDAARPHTQPQPPAPNPGAGLAAEGMRPLNSSGVAVAHDDGNHDHSNAGGAK